MKIGGGITVSMPKSMDVSGAAMYLCQQPRAWVVSHRTLNASEFHWRRMRVLCCLELVRCTAKHLPLHRAVKVPTEV